MSGRTLWAQELDEDPVLLPGPPAVRDAPPVLVLVHEDETDDR